MIAKPKLNSLLKKVDTRYTLISVVAKRTRELTNGQKPLVEPVNGNLVTTAAREVDAGKIEYQKEVEDE